MSEKGVRAGLGGITLDKKQKHNLQKPEKGEEKKPGRNWEMVNFFRLGLENFLMT